MSHKISCTKPAARYLKRWPGSLNWLSGSVDAFPCKFEARALPLRHERKSHVAVWPFEAYSTDLIHREGRAGRPIDANHEQLSIEGIATSIGGEGPLRGLALNIATTVSDGDDHPIGLVENYAHRILTKGWLQFIAGTSPTRPPSPCIHCSKATA